jgi:hypothetical protein
MTDDRADVFREAPVEARIEALRAERDALQAECARSRARRWQRRPFAWGLALGLVGPPAMIAAYLLLAMASDRIPKQDPPPINTSSPPERDPVCR